MTEFDSALMSLGIAVLQVVVLWAAVVVLLGAWRPTAGVARAMTPHALRFLIVAGLMAGNAPAHADMLDGLPLPDRVATSPDADLHIVQHGDSLWSIAAAQLSDDAGPADVALHTQRWYQANRVTVGPDPDLIQPGQRLTPPRDVS